VELKAWCVQRVPQVAKAAIIVLNNCLEALTENKTPSDVEANAINRIVEVVIRLILKHEFVS
jgi:hypothetical protein